MSSCQQSEHDYHFIIAVDVLQTKLYWEQNQNTLFKISISQIDKNWSGALPATLIINSKTGQRKFIERELHEGELEALIAEIL